jgi:hypothetical protein
MSLTGDFAGLRKLTEKLHEAARGKLMQEIKQEIAKEIESLVRSEWREHQSPKGIPWVGTAGTGLTMSKTGELMRSLQITVTSAGISVSLTGKTFKGGGGGVGAGAGMRSVASIQSFGGMSVSGFAKKSRNGAKLARYSANVYGHKGLMVFKTPNGWRRAYAVHRVANPVIPWGGTLPQRWEEAITRATERAIHRVLGG